MNDEATWSTADYGGQTAAPRRIPLDRDEALRLLGTVSLGRLVFTHQALPAVRAVSHLMDGGNLIVQLHDGAALASIVAPTSATGVVVAYEADAIDPVTRLGWSVVVTGYAHQVTDEVELARYAAVLRPWADHHAPDAALRIRPDLITGSHLSV
ncbi:pyridoxamine 5'-phosphate oxidase family protein [Streptomyces albidochromogenes]|uniref:pyridoxamine 5'-phosphate oxidase family protein n=1 Tax=Streptomyces albidochromogenes TaxID=329524 RepID=UPI00110F966D|nr:pyridoxamine 5'-phosphate oxidase family protein [Streptomyces albidochromogenes]